MSKFASMRTWYDQLMPSEQREMDEIRKAVGHPKQVLPPEQGKTGAEILDYSEKAIIAAKDPFFCIRINDCEMAMLGGGYPLPGSAGVDYMLRWLGFDRDAYRLRPEFLDAVQACPLLGLHDSWFPFSVHTAVYFAMLEWKLPHEKAVSAAVMYHALPRSLFSRLAHKRVVIIGSEAENLAAMWRTRSFLDAYAPFGPIDKVHVGLAIRTPSHPNPNWRCVDGIMDRLRKTPFDIALIGMGGLAKILSYRIWKELKRTALDMGAIFPAMLGGKHRQRHILKDIKWPEEKWPVELGTKL